MPPVRRAAVTSRVLFGQTNVSSASTASTSPLSPSLILLHFLLMAQPETLYLPVQSSPPTFLVFAKPEATASQCNKQTNKRKKQSNKVEVTVERQI